MQAGNGHGEMDKRSNDVCMYMPAKYKTMIRPSTFHATLIITLEVILSRVLKKEIILLECIISEINVFINNEKVTV